MRSTYKRFVWRATLPVNTADFVNEPGRDCLKCIRIDMFLSYFKKTVFIGRVARQTNRLYVLRMIVNLAYLSLLLLMFCYYCCTFAICTFFTTLWKHVEVL